MPAFAQFPNVLVDDQIYVVVTTRLTIRSPRTSLTFFRRLGRVGRQMRTSDGLVAFGLKAQLLRMTFSTYGVFESRRALADFMAAGAHGEAMAALKGRIHHIEARTVSLPGAEVPRSWDAIADLLEQAPTPNAEVTL